MVPLIQVIEEKDERQRLFPRDILPNVVIPSTSVEELFFQCKSFLQKEFKERKAEVQFLLYKIAVNLYYAEFRNYFICNVI